jgi:diguanylate cyclase (GGDEF)-like protein
MDMTVSEFELNGERIVTSVVRDITQRKQTENRLVHQATHDTLTGLPNRAQLHDRLERLISLHRTGDSRFALLLLDLDRFKMINDTFGHDRGDAVLKSFCSRLKVAVRQQDLIARMGGDEFAVLLPGAEEAVAVLIAERILGALEEPILVEGQPLDVRTSIGIALYPEHGPDLATLMQRADTAMYAAKKSCSERAVYSAGTDALHPRRLSLVGELREGITSDELVLHYQPKVNLASMQFDGVEALVRWQHPREGLMLPDKFIPLAERGGLMRPLSLWVLQTASQQSFQWLNTGLPLRVAVNLSAGDLDRYMIESIARLQQQSGVPQGSLTIEITEGALIINKTRARDVLAELHQLGVTISIDDFGTGHSSLAYLRDLPVDELKIDRSFVNRLTTNHKDQLIVKSVINLGHSLGLRVVAEGVETRADLEFLSAWGCDDAQGNYISRPLPASALRSWDMNLRNRGRHDNYTGPPER